jgi:hypothetical protein
MTAALSGGFNASTVRPKLLSNGDEIARPLDAKFAVSAFTVFVARGHGGET